MGLLSWNLLPLIAAVMPQLWPFDEWKRTHPEAASKTRTSQSGSPELEPLLSASGDQPEVRDRAGWEQRRAPFQRALREILGTLPTAKPPLTPRVLEETEHPAYIRRKVAYTGEPGEEITAYLFIPRREEASGTVGDTSEAQGPRPNAQRPAPQPSTLNPQPSRHPAVICLHGTWRSGKRVTAGLEGDESRWFAPQLAERGYVTLAPDAICFGERYHAGDPYQHYGDAPAFYATHPETSIMAKMSYDVGRAIDYLQTLPFVDAQRIGSIGHSHGAYGTLFAMLDEPRLKAGAASCGFTSFRTDPMFERWYGRTALLPALGFFEERVQDTPLDFHHILALLAPQPLFITAALQDKIFPNTENVPWIAEQVRGVYALYGRADDFGAYIFEGGHDVTPEARDRMYAFLDARLR
jgi:hypothetical protein